VSKKDQLHDEDGNFVGMQRYCEIVTPSWNWKWPHLMK
jgi:hypothetical protein